jgi:hypothetical protein
MRKARQTMSRHTGALRFSCVPTLIFGGVLSLGLRWGHSGCWKSDIVIVGTGKKTWLLSNNPWPQQPRNIAPSTISTNYPIPVNTSIRAASGTQFTVQFREEPKGELLTLHLVPRGCRIASVLRRSSSFYHRFRYQSGTSLTSERS